MSQKDSVRPGALVLTTDLPYFPGKMGVDFFNLRYLAGYYALGVVGPAYDSFPETGMANLEALLDGAYFWPRQAPPIHSMLADEPAPRLRSWVARLPSKVRLWAFRKLLKIDNAPEDALGKLAVLSNCAPQLLRAITERNWQAIVLIQTSVEPWLDYLPAMGGKFIYFHDVRADYHASRGAIANGAGRSKADLAAIKAQEQAALSRTDVAGFVSALDEGRARRLFDVTRQTGVAPIPVDTDYYTPAPAAWERDGRKIVLFTGHLGHPPNVDSVVYFVREVWPLVLHKHPDAVFQAVGMVPAEEVRAAIEATPNAELHENVPDIRPYFWNASAYVVPMRYGGGVRQKVFEAWSMRVPVICTRMAAEGTGAVDEEHCFLVDESASLAARISHTLQGGDGLSRMLDAAKDFVEATNSIGAAAPGFKRLVDAAVTSKRRKPFKVLFDLRWMELGHAGGIEQATYELVSAISHIDRKNGFRIMAPRSACGEWSFPRNFDVKFNYTDGAEKEVEAVQSLLVNGLAESFGVSPILNSAMRNLAHLHKLDFDIVHSVAGYTHPDLISFANVVTINDLQHLHYPEFFTPAEFEERERLYRQSAERASHIICISEFTRQDVHRQYGIPLEKMSTVWIVPSRNVWEPIAEDKRLRLLASMGVNGPFLFFPAHCWPHKNHARLIEAFASVLDDLPADLNLVMTGRSFPEDHPAAIAIRKYGLAGRVIHLGYRSPLEMRALFQSCFALVFPSLFEGYGMPVAEAIIAGRPVLCSNATSLPEIAGDAALTFDPSSVEDIGKALIALATQPELRARLSAAALRRRHLFSARRSAVQTLSIYQRVFDELYANHS